MRILFDALSLDSRASGTRTRLFGLLSELTRRGDLELAALHGPKLTDEERAAFPSVEWLAVPKAPRGVALRTMRQGPIYRVIGQRAQSDVVVADCVPFPTGVPLLPTLHDLRHVSTPGFRGRLYRKALRRGLDAARVIHVVSETVRAELSRFQPDAANHVFVVPNGVDQETFQPTPSDVDQGVLLRHGITEPFMLCVGHLEARKDPQTALDVRVRFAERGIDLPLIYIGRGECLPEEGLCWIEATWTEQRAGTVLRGVEAVDEM